MRYRNPPMLLLACMLAAGAARAEDDYERNGGGTGFRASVVNQAPLPVAGVPTALALLAGAGLLLRQRRRRSGPAI